MMRQHGVELRKRRKACPCTRRERERRRVLECATASVCVASRRMWRSVGVHGHGEERMEAGRACMQEGGTELFERTQNERARRTCTRSEQTLCKCQCENESVCVSAASRVCARVRGVCKQAVEQQQLVWMERAWRCAEREARHCSTVCVCVRPRLDILRKLLLRASALGP